MEQIEKNTKNEKSAFLYRSLWRLHFYAGLIILPFMLILAITGFVFLFKPQIDAAINNKYLNLEISGPAKPVSLQVAAALQTKPNAVLHYYELPKSQNAAARVFIKSQKIEHIVFINPQTLEILKALPKESQFIQIIRNIHGELLMGKFGSFFVEAAASWGIIMVISGLYLWWPRKSGIGGILYPRKGKLFLRDLHAVTGFYSSFFVLFLLVTGLPWADVWGDAFKEVRKITHTMPDKQDWVVNLKEEKQRFEEETAPPTNHQHGSMGSAMNFKTNIDDVYALSRNEKLEYPVEIAPPNKKSKNWVLRSNSQNRTKRVIIEISASEAKEVKRENFADRHIIDKIIGIGIAAHEGHLFGWFNQILGLLTVLSLCLMVGSSFLMWWKNRPEGFLGAPPLGANNILPIPIIWIYLIGAILLPVFGIMLILLAVIEKYVFVRFPTFRKWAGLGV